MTQKNKSIIIAVGLFFLYKISKAMTGKQSNSTTTNTPINMTAAINFSKFSNDSAAKLSMLQDSLIKGGFEMPQLKFALAQLLHETGNFTTKSKVAPNNTNYSGIVYINKPNVQKNAVKGTPFPAKEGKYFYAKFATVADWAADFKRVLNLKNKPIKAIDLLDYYNKLTDNKYYDTRYPQQRAAYKAGLFKYYDMLT